MTTLQEIEAVAARHGISPTGNLPNEWERDGRAKEPWAEDHVEQVEACRAYIRSAPPRDMPRRRWTFADSYGLKHRVERQAKLYICNGSFIVAAHLEGLRVKPIGINATFMRAAPAAVASSPA